MAYIFSTGAVLRLLFAQRSDELVRWLEVGRICPQISNTTMATVRYTIRATDIIAPNQRTALEKRYEQLVRDLNENTRKQVITATFDLKSAEILSDILSIGAARDTLSDMDLVPAAIAIQHNLELVITDEVAAWGELSQAIPTEIGKLSLKSFPTSAV